MGFYAKRVNEFYIGHWVLSKVQWVMSIVILLKLFDARVWIYFVIIPVVLIVTWVVGIIFHRVGLWDGFVRENLDAINVRKK